MKLWSLSFALALWSIGADARVWGDWNGHYQSDCPIADTTIVKHEGTPIGKEQVFEGLNFYVTAPPGKRPEKAVLYITDVFVIIKKLDAVIFYGIQLAQNKLLADSFARAGYLTVAPDLFDGQPAPSDINQPGFNTTAFLARNNVTTTDPKVAKSIRFIRESLGAKKVGAVGYCFGGRYSFRFAAQGGGLDATFAAHPSLLEDAEINGTKIAASVAVAETDSMLTPARRSVVENLLKNTGVAYQISLYGGTSHGFGVRANTSDPRQKFAKEEAFFQAVRWFDTWL